MRKRLLLLLFCFSLSMMTPLNVLAVGTGQPAPQFSLKDMAGREVSLSDFAGRLVLLKLATTWCPSCFQLSAEIEQLGEFLKQRDVVVLEVFIQDSPAMVERYLGDKKKPMTFHALIDDGQAHKAYNVYVIPRLLLIDAKQVVRFDSLGGNVLAADIRQMVEGFSAAGVED